VASIELYILNRRIRMDVSTQFLSFFNETASNFHRIRESGIALHCTDGDVTDFQSWHSLGYLIRL